MLKLQDFSKQQGVSDRQVQRLLKKYENELEGLFERKGPNGTWLSDEACEILRSKMKSQPMVVYEEDPKVALLQQENEALRRQLDKANEDFRRYAAGTAEALSKATAQLQLAERAEAYQAKAQEAEERAHEAELKVEATEKQIDLAVKRKVEVELALEEARERMRTAEDIAELNAQEAARAKAEAEELKTLLDQIATSRGLKRRKLLKELNRRE